MIFRMTRCVRGSTIGNRPGARAANQRLFVNDLNGPLYLLDKETRKLSLYLNFNGARVYSWRYFDRQCLVRRL